MIQVGILASTLAMRTGLQTLLEGDATLEVSTLLTGIQDLGLDSFAIDVLMLIPDDFDTSLGEIVTLLPNGTGLLILQDEALILPASIRHSLRAWGILSVDATAEELTAAVHAIHEGLNILPPDIFERFSAQAISLDLPGEEEILERPLTERETEILRLLAQGLANKQIAEVLGISIHTVKFHISTIYGKMGASNRADAVRLGLQYGLLAL